MSRLRVDINAEEFGDQLLKVAVSKSILTSRELRVNSQECIRCGSGLKLMARTSRL